MQCLRDEAAQQSAAFNSSFSGRKRPCLRLPPCFWDLRPLFWNVLYNKTSVVMQPQAWVFILERVREGDRETEEIRSSRNTEDRPCFWVYTSYLALVGFFVSFCLFKWDFSTILPWSQDGRTSGPQVLFWHCLAITIAQNTNVWSTFYFWCQGVGEQTGYMVFEVIYATKLNFFLPCSHFADWEIGMIGYWCDVYKPRSVLTKTAGKDSPLEGSQMDKMNIKQTIKYCDGRSLGKLFCNVGIHLPHLWLHCV